MLATKDSLLKEKCERLPVHVYCWCFWNIFLMQVLYLISWKRGYVSLSVWWHLMRQKQYSWMAGMVTWYLFVKLQSSSLSLLIAGLHLWMSLYFLKMKTMIAYYFLLFGHALLCTVSIMAKDLPVGHFTRRRDVSSQSLLGKLQKAKQNNNKKATTSAKTNFKYKDNEDKKHKRLAKPWLS